MIGRKITDQIISCKISKPISATSYNNFNNLAQKTESPHKNTRDFITDLYLQAQDKEARVFGISREQVEVYSTTQYQNQFDRLKNNSRGEDKASDISNQDTNISRRNVTRFFINQKDKPIMINSKKVTPARSAQMSHLNDLASTKEIKNINDIRKQAETPITVDSSFKTCIQPALTQSKPISINQNTLIEENSQNLSQLKLSQKRNGLNMKSNDSKKNKSEIRSSNQSQKKPSAIKLKNQLPKPSKIPPTIQSKQRPCTKKNSSEASILLSQSLKKQNSESERGLKLDQSIQRKQSLQKKNLTKNSIQAAVLQKINKFQQNQIVLEQEKFEKPLVKIQNQESQQNELCIYTQKSPIKQSEKKNVNQHSMNSKNDNRRSSCQTLSSTATIRNSAKKPKQKKKYMSVKQQIQLKLKQKKQKQEERETNLEENKRKNEIQQANWQHQQLEYEDQDSDQLEERKQTPQPIQSQMNSQTENFLSQSRGCSIASRQTCSKILDDSDDNEFLSAPSKNFSSSKNFPKRIFSENLENQLEKNEKIFLKQKLKTLAHQTQTKRIVEYSDEENHQQTQKRQKLHDQSSKTKFKCQKQTYQLLNKIDQNSKEENFTCHKDYPVYKIQHEPEQYQDAKNIIEDIQEHYQCRSVGVGQAKDRKIIKKAPEVSSKIILNHHSILKISDQSEVPQTNLNKSSSNFQERQRDQRKNQLPQEESEQEEESNPKLQQYLKKRNLISEKKLASIQAKNKPIPSIKRANSNYSSHHLSEPIAELDEQYLQSSGIFRQGSQDSQINQIQNFRYQENRSYPNIFSDQSLQGQVDEIQFCDSSSDSEEQNRIITFKPPSFIQNQQQLQRSSFDELFDLNLESLLKKQFIQIQKQ